MSARDLDRASTKLTRGLILCSPCNPTGAVYTLAELKAIAEWARKHEVWIISDEIYRRINYGTGPAASLLDLPDELLERTIVIYGASKAYAMTGWRIGAALAPPHVTKAMAALQSHTTTGANHPAQWAAATAFTDERVEAEVQRMVAAFRRRRDYLVDALPGARRPASSSSSRTAPSTSSSGWTASGSRSRSPARPFCEQLMQQEGVALVPGAAFGDDRWVRLSYAVSDRSSSGARPHRPAHPAPGSGPCRLRPRREHGGAHRAARLERCPSIAWRWDPGDRHSLRRVQGQPRRRRAHRHRRADG